MKKTNKKIIAMIIVLIMLLAIIPFNAINVFATGYGSGDYGIRLGIDSNEEDFMISNITVDGHDWTDNNDEFFTSNGTHTVEINVWGKTDKYPDIGWGGNWNGEDGTITKSMTEEWGIYTYTLTINCVQTGAKYVSLNVNPINKQKINTVNVNVAASAVGTKILDENTKPNITLESNANYSVSWTMYVNNYPSVDPTYDSGEIFGTTIENGKDYYVEVYLKPKLGYIFDSSSDVTLKVNGGTEYELGYCSEDQISFFTKVTASEGETTPGTKSDIKVEATFNDTMGEVVIGNQRTAEGASYKGTLEGAGTTNPDEKNTIIINTSFSEPYAKKVVINNQEYTFTDAKESHSIEVAGAEEYKIEVYGDTSIVTPKTIIWTNPDYVPKDEEDAEWVSQFSIKHGTAKIIEVRDPEGNKLAPEEYINTQEQPDGSKSDEYGLNNGFGWIGLMPGSKATFEFYPEYGYQLTSVAINEQPMEASATANQFTVEIPNANLHFAAEFTKTEDIVKASSEKVSSGTIELGNALPGGSAQLTVNDIELSEDKISGFENAAEGYTVSNYLDIDLYNIFYKGKADSEDVWLNKISELDEYATISIQLKEGVNAEDIVIVHNIHDGDEFEIIEIDSYDPETRTITFKTKSFSNYAIATKTATDETTSNVKTGDNIAIFVTMFVMATLGTVTLVTINRRNFKK